MAEFKDFDFELMVAEALIYGAGTPTPVFGIDERSRAAPVGDLHSHVYDNGWEHSVLDESRAYFEALEIGGELPATVDELGLDGGNQVFCGCSPVRDGEDDLFDVRSPDDLPLLPNLRRVLGAGTVAVPDKTEPGRHGGLLNGDPGAAALSRVPGVRERTWVCPAGEPPPAGHTGRVVSP
ncbi:DUF6892 domain-containing protein [Streptomyces pratensis]|uniref:DUF6892 domain-containing protein n=1 Tax=Streptomyces pratensis TaxID=1169025 RepID=UPI001934AB5D|nr:hypothetical protein [Streptomyces pratensis]